MLIVSKVLKSILIVGLLFVTACGANNLLKDRKEDVLELKLNDKAIGPSVNIYLEKGNSHNHPTFSIWAEDMNESFIQTLFVTKSIATGIFGHGPLDSEKWDTKPGWQIRPAALPYWVNKRNPTEGGNNLPDPDHPVADAYSGATPPGSVDLVSKLDKPLKGKIRIVLEVNQPWDWNEFWTNKLYDDAIYRTSCQPSLVYSVTVNLDEPGKEYYLNPIGHGHYSGENGQLYTDLSTITTAREIFSKLRVVIK